MKCGDCELEFATAVELFNHNQMVLKHTMNLSGRLHDALNQRDAEIEQLRAGYVRLRDATDTEMGDGDLAREIAIQMIGMGP